MSGPSEGAPASLIDAFGVVLEGVRTQRGLTLDAVAAKAGIAPAEVRLIEKGICEPTLTEWLNLALAVGISPIWWLEESFAWAGLPEPKDPSGQHRLLRRIVLGRAARSTVERCSAQELQRALVIGERLADELATWGLVVVELPKGRSSGERPL